jgi:hypothetical protein
MLVNSRLIDSRKEEEMTAITLYPQWSLKGVGNLQELHRSMQNKAFVGKIVSFLNGRSRRLLDLTTEVSKRKILRQHYAGSRTVPINRIKGSEGRSGDFDCDFNPLHARTKDRWMSVAMARSQEATLPLVELIQLGDAYFVRDGHHRISVARAFGEDYIDAKVIVLELEPVSVPLFTNTTFEGETSNKCSSTKRAIRLMVAEQPCAIVTTTKRSKLL